ncbi:hypothetical protein EG329_002375 [Mollisiaceae sp. DMI_Dod_QoI]|nr:hypothetical protein EG329_002375 [Helotiales sp. DMI_Dod_QoI]
MFARSTIAVALMAAVVVAQTTNNTIDPNSVPSTTRSQWCQAQTNTCGTLCSGDYNNNSCIPDTLTFSCTCASNNSQPGLQYYKETMPTFICEQIFTNCIAQNVGDAAAQALCNSNEQNNCGHLDPDNFTAVATTTSSSSTSATAAATSAAGSGSATSSSSKAAAATLAAMRNFGTGALAIGVGAAFGYMV